MDVRNFSGAQFDPLSLPTMAMACTSNDSSSRVYATSVTADSGTADTCALITWFNIVFIPNLNITLSPTNVVLSWRYESLGFRLETSPTINVGASWQAVTQPVTTNFTTNPETKQVTVPRDPRTDATFFRLIWRPPP